MSNQPKCAINLKNHPSLVLHSEIAAICKPFLQRYNYCIFNFIRLYHDGRVMYLCDNYDWLSYYLKKGYPAIGAFEQNNAFRNQKYILWDALNDNDPVVIYSRELFNIKYGITLVCQFKEGYDYFNFGTKDNASSVMHTMTNQLNELYQFTELFYDKAHRLIKAAEKDNIKLDQFILDPIPQKEIQKLYLGPDYDYHHLTAKEIVYLKNLAQGKTVPEMATSLHVSPRTIEKHIENIKQKLGCRTQCELGYLIAKLGILIDS